MMVYSMLNNIVDDVYNLYVYYSHVKCICQYWMYMYWCYIIIYGKVCNILGGILKYNNNVIIYELVNVYCCII